MKAFSRIITAFLVAFVATGCADNLVAPEGPVEKNTITKSPGTPGSKARHFGMMEDALEGGRDAAGKDAPELGLIVKIGKESLLERFKVLERYKMLERYKVLERYEYNDVIGGFAITVEDALGLEEYNAFLNLLENDPDVVWYEPDFSLEMPLQDGLGDGSSQVMPWSVAAIGGETSWTVSGNGSGTVDVDVYVVDTGVARADNNDPNDDLALTESIDFFGDGSAADPDGHGTHIAGIIGAIDDNDGTVGVAPGARIHNMRVLGPDGTADMSIVLAAIEHITKTKRANPSKPIVVNLSLGEYLGSEGATALDDAIDASLAAGVHYVVAAGNQGQNAAFCTPAKVKGALTVGSYDVNGMFSGFSNYGPKVDILAPGEGIVSLSKVGGHTATMTGTSMAAAHVTGAVALYVARNPNATPAEAMAAVLNKAESFVLGMPSNTTRKSVWVGERSLAATLGGATQDQTGQTGTTLTTQSTDTATTDAATTATPAASTLPGFLTYAVMAHGKIQMDEAAIRSAGAGNANVHANDELKIDDDDAEVYGFGTSTKKVDGDTDGVFRPVSNPDNRKPFGLSAQVTLERFDARNFQSLATKTSGGNVKLEDDLTLGTADQPVFYFVDGNLKIDDDIKISGYGAIFVRGKIEIEDDVETDGPGRLGLFASDEIKVEDGVSVDASLVSGAKIEFGEDARVNGSISAFGEIQMKEDVTVVFTPLAESVARRFW